VGSDQELLITLRTVLLRPEYHIVSCADRGSAILFLKGDPRYDLLLFDLELHGSTGLKLARLAQSLPHRRRTPKILATLHEITGSLEELARKAGVNKCLTKTEGVDELSQTIICLLERESVSYPI
jgi:CheY-like chemotaxis protein